MRARCHVGDDIGMIMLMTAISLETSSNAKGVRAFSHAYAFTSDWCSRRWVATASLDIQWAFAIPPALRRGEQRTGTASLYMFDNAFGDTCLGRKVYGQLLTFPNLSHGAISSQAW